MRIPHQRLRIWLATMVCAALLPSIIVVGLTVWHAGQTLKDSSLRLLNDSASIVANAVEGELHDEAVILSTMAATRARNGEVILIGQPTVPGGQIASGSLPPEAIGRARARGRATLSNLFQPTPAAAPRILLSVPVHDINGNTAVAARLLSPGEIVHALQRHEQRLDNILVAVTDGTGHIIARSRSPERYIGKPVPDWQTLLDVGADQGTFDAKTKEGGHVKFAFQRLRGTPGWVVVVGEPLDQFNARWRDPLIGLIGAAALAIALALLVSAWLARLIVRPIQALALHAGHVAADAGYAASSEEARSTIIEFEQLRANLDESEAALRRRAEAERLTSERLTTSERRYRALAEVGALVFWRRDLSGAVTSATGWTELTGQQESSSLGNSWYDSVHPDDHLLIAAVWDQAMAGGSALDAEFRIRSPSGSWRWVRARGAPILGRDGTISEWAGVLEDVDERRQVQARIAHMAHHDALTDLPNRLLFNEKLNATIQSCAAGGDQAAILCLDLDRFKEVNDTLGHPVGDALLRAVTGRLLSYVKASDVVARLGGDEFAIILRQGRQPIAASGLAARLIREISAPYELGDHRIVIGASIGITLVGGATKDADDMMREADLALYRAKADGRQQFCFFEPGMDAQMQERRRMEVDLRRALAAGEFQLWYQPLVSISDRALVSFEALLRWDHPEFGIIEPHAFMPIAEEIGLMVPIGRQILREACAQATSWPTHIRIAVNLSPSQLAGSGLVDTVARILLDTGLTSERLELEITEDGLGENPPVVLETLRLLKELGVRITMDNFGIGRSSLGYLRTFPFDKVKIDGSFVRGLGAERESEAIFRSIATLCGSLGITTAAQGVETEAQFDYLGAETCIEAQGYLFCEPRPASEIASLFASHFTSAGGSS